MFCTNADDRSVVEVRARHWSSSRTIYQELGVASALFTSRPTIARLFGSEPDTFRRLRGSWLARTCAGGFSSRTSRSRNCGESSHPRVYLLTARGFVVGHSETGILRGRRSNAIGDGSAVDPPRIRPSVLHRGQPPRALHQIHYQGANSMGVHLFSCGARGTSSESANNSSLSMKSTSIESPWNLRIINFE